MSPLSMAWTVALIAAGWFLSVGAVRMLAYRSGQVDHDPGMKRVAQLSLGLGIASLVVLVVLTALIVGA